MQWWFSASTYHWYPRQLPACLPCAYQNTSPAAQQEYFGAVLLVRASLPFPRSTVDPGNCFIKSTMPLTGQKALGILALQLPWAIFAFLLSYRNSSDSVYPCLAIPGKLCGYVEAWHKRSAHRGLCWEVIRQEAKKMGCTGQQKNKQSVPRIFSKAIKENVSLFQGEQICTGVWYSGVWPWSWFWIDHSGICSNCCL